jgi:hypothetical protein
MDPNLPISNVTTVEAQVGLRRTNEIGIRMVLGAERNIHLTTSGESVYPRRRLPHKIT